jgi:hypothetical protein
LLEHTSSRIKKFKIERPSDVIGLSSTIACFSPGMHKKKEELRKFLRENLYFHPYVVRMCEKAQRYIEQLFDAYTHNPRQLELWVQRKIEEEGKYRAMCDYLAGMTDRFAIAECAKLFDHNYGYLHGEEYVKAIQESDIFVYPSLYDGFPAPPLEALACGSALVTTAVEGVTEYAVDGENCLLCKPGNAVMMRDNVIRLVHDATLRERLRSNGPKTAKAYSVERSARQLLEFLLEICDDMNTSDRLPTRSVRS